MVDYIPSRAVVSTDSSGNPTTYQSNLIVYTSANVISTNSNIYVSLSGNVGIGTASVSIGNALAVYGGNIIVGSSGGGIKFADGSFQSGAAASTPPAGGTGAVQYNSGSSTFAGDVNKLIVDTSGNVGVGTSTVTAPNKLSIYGGNVTIGSTGSGLVIGPNDMNWSITRNNNDAACYNIVNTSLIIKANGGFQAWATNGQMQFWGYNSSGYPTLTIPGNADVRLDSGVALTWGLSGVTEGGFYREAAYQTGLRNSTNATSFYVYNTYTSASAFERFAIKWVGNLATIGTETTGGTARNLAIQTAGVARMTIDTSGNVGIGTTTISAGNTFAVYGGNIQIGTAGSGLRFPDGTTMSTAASGGGGSITITNDTSTNANTYYPSMTNNVTSGTLSGLTTSSTKLYFNPSTGTLNATVFNSLSDQNLKGNIVPISGAINKVNAMQGVGFEWKDSGKKSYGIIAQQLEQILPDIVDTNEKGMKSVNYNAIIGFLIEAVKDLNREVSSLKYANKSTDRGSD